MKYEDIPKDELQLVSDKMIGLVLMNAEKDSDGNPIKPYSYYKLEKHIPSGLLIITLGKGDMIHEFKNDVLNGVFKRKGKFN